jgi:hypothetical protein
MTMAMKRRAAAALVAGICVLGLVAEAAALGGGFGGTSGGGMRPTGSSSAGFNRAGTSSSGGFAYGDAPRSPATPPTVKEGTAQPCNTEPVTVDGAKYYKCEGVWYTPALSDSGIVYTKVPAPPGR